MTFDRVVVQRDGRPPLTSPFVHCVECQAVYHAPAATPVTRESRRIVDRGRHAALMRDVVDAAKSYLKPSRRPRPGDRARDAGRRNR